MRVLLMDGSGATARQVATHLGEAGHEVHAVSPDPLALVRFTRHVRRVHRVPAYGRDPTAWLDATLAVVRREGLDVVLPTHEQVAVLARETERVAVAGAAAALPPFASLRRVQDKVSAARTLAELGLRQPPWCVASSEPALRDACASLVPAYVKPAVGTASAGVRRLYSPGDLAAHGLPLDDGVLVQRAMAGELAMLQAVFYRGELVAWHANLRVRSGARGGAAVKRSLPVAAAAADVARLGAALDWHGGLSLDAILTGEGPCYIDVNPRLVEPGNARAAGVDLAGALLGVSVGARPRGPVEGRSGVTTRQTLIGLLGAAERPAAAALSSQSSVPR